jgi:hypothetical protein
VDAPVRNGSTANRSSGLRGDARVFGLPVSFSAAPLMPFLLDTSAAEAAALSGMSDFLSGDFADASADLGTPRTAGLRAPAISATTNHAKMA